MTALIIILIISAVVAFSLYNEDEKWLFPILIMIGSVVLCFYLNSGYIKDLFSGKSYDQNEYHVILDSNKIKIKMTCPVVGHSWGNEASWASPPNEIGQDIYDSFSLLKRWIYTGGVTEVRLIVYSEDSYGNKVEHDWGVMVRLNSNEVIKYSNYHSFNKAYNIEHLIYEKFFGTSRNHIYIGY